MQAPPYSASLYQGEGAANVDAPAGFHCPLTGILMRDPYLLRDSGISAEQAALEWMLHVQPGACPVTGIVLTETTPVPDSDLQKRIWEWAAVQQPELLVRAGRVLLASAAGKVPAAH